MIVRNIYHDNPVSVPDYVHTLDGFREWVASDEYPESGLVALLGKELFIDMSPERLQTHNKPKTVVNSVLWNLVNECDLGELYHDRLWLTNDAAGLSTEPDCTFASWNTIQSGRVKIVPVGDDEDDGVELRGSPDWVLEVVSKTSERKDKKVLPELYHRAGICEYWLIDTRRNELQFTVFHYTKDKYVVAEPLQGWLWSEVFQREFQMERSRHQLGRWRYLLHVRARTS